MTSLSPGGMTSFSPGGMTPPVTPPSMGSPSHCPLAGAEPRDGACGAEYVSGWLRLLVRCHPG
jgi:hypothetical protein